MYTLAVPWASTWALLMHVSEDPCATTPKKGDLRAKDSDCEKNWLRRNEFVTERGWLNDKQRTKFDNWRDEGKMRRRNGNSTLPSFSTGERWRKKAQHSASLTESKGYDDSEATMEETIGEAREGEEDERHGDNLEFELREEKGSDMRLRAAAGMDMDLLLGEPDEAGFVTNGLFAIWTRMDGGHSFQRMFVDQDDGEFINDARIDLVMTQDIVENVMALFSSSNDPIFMHHGFIDSIWEHWRQNKQSRLQRETDFPRNNAACAPRWHFSEEFMSMLQPLWNIDVFFNNYTDNMYEFVPRPGCARTGNSEECGSSDYLWCDSRTNGGHAVCTSKMKPGGNCAGFEWSAEVCYGDSQCVEGRRTKAKTMDKENDGGKARKMDDNGMA
ncbi:hypothetical protein niasHT_002508 [Heterodera trifolii]|uniref:Tyrosinase copper-binding domain-containing protein n=1 Tax=Heterodera trifolii TaxID=157864 RepID=A0ABD2M7Y1_9BILA